MKSATWNRLLATTVISGFASVALATPAWAQGTTQTVPVPESTATTAGGEVPTLETSEEEPEGIETGTGGTTIFITGSRIPRPDLTSSSPVTIVDDEQVALTGTVTLGTLLNDLPSVIPGNNRTSNNAGGFPFSTLDLRGLGAQRTLILIDGERIPHSSAFGVVDISQIPVGLIERVDVVTGGASAIYGSDAMAGVVNFILKQDFSGLEITGQTGIAQEGVGFNYNVSGLFGGSFADNRGNVTVYSSYYNREGVKQSRFDYSRVAATIFFTPDFNIYMVDDPSKVLPGSLTFFSGGSITPPWGIVSNNAANPFTGLSAAVGGMFVGADHDCNPATAPINVNGGNLSFDPVTGELRPYTSAGLCSIARQDIGAMGSSRYNYAPANFLTIPYDRFNLSSTARYEFDDRTTGRLFAAFTDTNSTVELAPTPAFGGTGFVIDPVLVAANCTGAQAACALPADLQAALNTRPNPNAPFSFGRRFEETGPRIGLTDNKSIILRTSLDHELSPDWTVSGGASWGRNRLTQYNIGNINRVAVDQGLVGCRNSAGVINGPGVLPGCVPVNIYGPNTITPEMLAFIQTDTVDISTFEQVRTSVNLAGSAFNLPGGPIGIALGAEWRRDTGDVIRDDAKRRGEIIGFNAQENQAGEISVKEAYGEVRFPILGGGTGFPDMLAVELGGRYSDYSTIGGLFNWKAAAEFGPVPWLRFRGAYNKAARAPNIFELFQAGDQGFPAYSDPCNAGLGGAALPNCIAHVPAAILPTFQQANSQVQAFAFGQPDLAAESAETYTVGAVFNPAWWPVGRMSLTVDYYDITITDRIAALGAQFYINQCYIANIADACARITRDPATGEIFRVNTGRTNSAVPLVTRGIDVGFNWAIPVGNLVGGLGGGTLRIGELFNYTIDFKIGDLQLVDRIAAGVGAPVPKWNNTLTVAYEQGAVTTQVRWVYKSGADQDDYFGPFWGVERVPDLSYFDLSLRVVPTERFEITGIVQNLFDKYPKQTISGFFEQANVNASFFSPIMLGRSFLVQSRVRF